MESNLKKYSIVYLTINTKNNKIYIGIHDTLDPTKFCGYLGCGVNRNRPSTIKHPTTPFMYAVKKYGFDSFKRVTLKIFDNRDDAKKLEALLVDQFFIEREDTYNVALGGGDPPKNECPVYQYDLCGNFINCYPSFHLAGIENGGKGGSSIRLAAINKCCAFESFWSTDFVDHLDISEYQNTIQRVEVHLYDAKGNYLQSFRSQSEAIKFLNVSLGVLQRAILLKNKVKGYYATTNKVDRFVKEKSIKTIKPVYQYTLDGKFLKEFPNCNCVSKELGKSYTRISSVLKMGNRKCGNFLWSYEKVENLSPYINSHKKVACYDKTGALVKIYDKVRDARREFANVGRVLSGKVTHCKGYIFKYI